MAKLYGMYTSTTHSVAWK